MTSQKYIFLQALIITFVIFNLGIFMGYKLEASRINKIDNLYLQSELELLDQKIQKDAFGFIDLDCDLVIQENINFADRIFEEALAIKEFEDASRINEDIVFYHKKFDLLRTLFWVNSMQIKQKCNADYHNLVYFYQYETPSIEQEANQKLFSHLLSQIKQEKGGDVMLIPIAADNDLPSINLLMDKYGIDKTNLPVILIDEDVRISDVKKLEDLRNYLD